MARLKAIYRCEVCGNMIHVIFNGGETLICCGQPMELLNENSTHAAPEKHIPIIEKVDRGVVVKVGSVEHPMTREHYIQWIELITGDKSYRQFLSSDSRPEAFFAGEFNDISARTYCNLHGLWKNN